MIFEQEEATALEMMSLEYTINAGTAFERVVNITTDDVIAIGSAPMPVNGQIAWGTKINLIPDSRAADEIGLATVFDAREEEHVRRDLQSVEM